MGGSLLVNDSSKILLLTHLKLNMGDRETDSEQVPRGKYAKNFEKRVKQYLKLLKGKRLEPMCERI